MQNSIWKLTALAGVIGIGFLIALQTQSGLNADKEAAQSEALSPTIDNTQPEGASVASNAMGLFQSEPSASGGAAEPPSRARSPEFNVRLASNEEPRPEPDNGFDAATARPSRTTRTPEAGRQPSAFDSERRPGRTLPEFSDTETSRSSAFDEPPVSPDNELPQESSKAKLLRLMAEARDAKEAGQLVTARVLLMEAIELPVVLGALENRPAVMLAEIDAILKARRQTAANQSDSQKKRPLVVSSAGLSAALPDSGDERLPRSNSEIPLLKEDLTDEPFGESDPFAPSEPIPATDKAATDKPLPTRIAAAPKPLIPLPDADADPVPTPRRLQQLPDDENPLGSSDTSISSNRTDREPDRKSDISPIVKASAKKAPREELVIEKVAPENARLGQPMIYSLFIENRGSVAATSVLVEDTIPKSCELQGTSPQAEMVGQKLSWRIGRIEVGQRKKILVKMVPNEVGDISTDARVSSIPESPNAIAATKRPSSSKLRLSVSGPERVKLGDAAVLKFKLVNAGSEAADEVNLQNIIPAGFRHTDGNDLTYPIGKLESGQSLEVELTLKAVKPGSQVNRTIVTASGGMQTEAATAVEVIDNRPLRVETTEAATMPVGQPTVQETRLINESAADVEGVSIIEQLPDGLRFVKASHSGQFDAVARKVRWKLDRIPAGETAVLKLTVLPKTPGPHACVIEVNQSDRPQTESVESRVRARGVSALAIEMNHEDGTVVTGDEFPVNVRLRNRGNGADFNVAMILRLPPELEFVQARGPVKYRVSDAASGIGKIVSFTAMPEFGEKTAVDFQITLRAKLPGKAKLRAEVVSDEVPDPIGSETFIVVLDGSP